MRFVEPEKVVTHFHIRAGDMVADYGAGSGYFIKPLAQLVGAEGKVYAIEIQKNLVETITALAHKDGLGMVDVLWGDLEAAGGSKLQDGSIDVGVVVNTLFQLEDKAVAAAEIVRTLRPGAKLFVIDWSESFQGLGPAPDHVMSEQDAIALFESAGVTYERSYDAGDHHYGLAFRV